MIDLSIEDEGWAALSDAQALADRAYHACRAAFPNFPDGEVGLLLTGDAAVKAMNRQWRGIDKPTNVLSFPTPAPHRGHLGDIVLGFETVRREAADEEKTWEAHVLHLIVHGLLHLIGYDHDNEDKAGIMEALEKEILERLGIADPYRGIAAA